MDISQALYKMYVLAWTTRTMPSNFKCPLVYTIRTTPYKGRRGSVVCVQLVIDGCLSFLNPNPIKVSRCFLEQETLSIFLSTGCMFLDTDWHVLSQFTRLYWYISQSTRLYWYISKSTRLYWYISQSTRLYWYISQSTRLYWYISQSTRLYW